MIACRADWVVPIATPPVRGGWISVEGAHIAAVGTAHDVPDRARDLGRVALLPGLVNAHTHLELSYLRGQVPAAEAFITWIRGVMASRRQRPDARSAEILDGVAEGIAESIRCGTALVGDISNTLVTVDPLRHSLLGGVVFYELIRFHTPDPDAVMAQACEQIDRHPPSSRVQVSLAAHAPYSVSPALFRAMREAIDRRPGLPCSVHLSEAAEEVEFLATGEGPWRAFLEEVGSWSPAWVPPRASPVAFLEASGFLDDRVLAVHGVQMSPADLARLAARGTTLVTCPRSNRNTGAGVPPIADFYASGVPVAVGTDSLASTPDLNVFAELAALRALAPEVPAARLLDSATRVGARALGFGHVHGTLQRGASARVLAVTLPPGVTDVEEYLVSGVQPEQVSWLEAPAQAAS